jgi:SIR2-like domain
MAQQAAASALRRKLERGHPVTLVLGAGVSFARGVPSWTTLARTVCRELGVSLPGDVAAIHPLGLPIAFELAERAALRRAPTGGAPFAERLRTAMYASLVDGTGEDSLAALTRVLVREQAKPERTIRRVVTFNADDLLENEANGDRDPFAEPVLWAITREAARPREDRGAGGRAPIPVYPLHGFLPRPGAPLARRDATDTLVFTEAQYWASFAEPASFPNRVMMNALHDSVCVFLGLSMTDVNVARWLGLRAGTVCKDLGADRSTPGLEGRSVRDSLDHHFWIRRAPDAGSAEAYVTPLLRERGVRVVDLEHWGQLGPLLDSLFS